MKSTNGSTTRTHDDPLFDRPAPANYQPTSKAAAAAIRPDAPGLRKRVYDWLMANGPATDEQMIEALGMNESTERPRRGELVEAGFVVDTGRKFKTRAGRNAILWAAVVVRPEA